MFIEILRNILWSSTLEEARQRFFKTLEVLDLTYREREVLQFIYPALKDCFICRDPAFLSLRLPRSSNAIENVIGHIEARFKTRRGNKSIIACEALINDILLRVGEQTITHN